MGKQRPHELQRNGDQVDAPHLNLGTSQQASAARARVAKAKAEVIAKNKRTDRTAWMALQANSDLVNRIVDTEGFASEVVYETAPLIHASHALRKTLGADVLFCNHCGAWTQGGKLRLLAAACRWTQHKKANGRGHKIRLLQLGIVPTKYGARIPKQFKMC